MTTPIIAQKNAIASVISMLRQGTKASPKERDLLIPRLQAAIDSLTDHEWSLRNKHLIIKAREMEKLEAGNVPD